MPALVEDSSENDEDDVDGGDDEEWGLGDDAPVDPVGEGVVGPDTIVQ